ncbi:hypothetical protein V7176_22505, partial [Cytobacillus firmus]
IEKNNKVKYESDAIINVKFKNKIKKGKQITSFVRGYESLMSRLNDQIDYINKQIVKIEADKKESKNTREIDKMDKTLSYYRNKLKLIQGHISRIENDKDNVIYSKKTSSELRNQLYLNGFTYKGRKYRFFQRTASKGRQSKTLFILEELYKDMEEWSLMGLDLTGKVDVASALAYMALTGSSIEATVEINPKNIFIIGDKFSKFFTPAIEVGNDLKAIPVEKSEVINNIWDGQGLIDISLMEKAGRADKGMVLLRHHFFKSCCFNTNIQKYLMDKHEELTNPEHENYDPSINKDYTKCKVTDHFGNAVYLKNILLTTTPSSLKYLKFAGKGDEKEAYANWCERVKADKIWGICKSEKGSKYGDRSFASYQMINTLFADKEDIQELAKFEVDFIKDLQGRKDDNGKIDEQPFIDYLNNNKELTNAYEMLHSLYQINPEVIRTQMFRDYRKRQITNYRTKIKGGKLRLEADYCTVVSEPYLMLQSILEGKRESNFVEEESVLKVGQIYTTLHEFDEEYTLVRNPHNSANNFYKSRNVSHLVFKKYFNFTDNIVAIPTIKSPILSRLNGMDMDSDTCLIFKDDNFNRIIDKTLQNRNYPLIQNTIVPKADPKEFTLENIAAIDEKTSKSQSWIGEVTNAAQYQVSILHDIQNNEPESEEKEKKIAEIMANTAILVVLSNVAIDYSKKIVEVDIDQALRKIRSSEAAKVADTEVTKTGKVKVKLKKRKKPNFWKYVSTSDVEMEEFNCPMDILINHINNDIADSYYRKNLPFGDMLIEMNPEESAGADMKQVGDILKLVRAFSGNVEKVQVQSEGGKDEKKCQERSAKMKKLYDDLDARIAKKKIKKATMYAILSEIANLYAKGKKKKKSTQDLSGIVMHLMNV